MDVPCPQEELKQRIEVFGKVTNIKMMKKGLLTEEEVRLEDKHDTVAYVR